MRSALASTRKACCQSGYTLLEILIAMLIGLFLLGGLLTIEQYHHAAFLDQNKLVQLQDNERMAMTMLANVIQSAGYFPDPSSNTAADLLTASAPFAAGQGVTGSYSASAPGDTITVRYATANGDGVLNCSGLSNTTGDKQVYVNAFSVTGGQLVCSMNGTQYPLVSGVTNLSILYGVKTDFATDNYNVDTYLTASQMTTANWNYVISVVVTLTFTNPLYVSGQAQPETFTVQRVVGVMSKTGLKV